MRIRMVNTGDHATATFPTPGGRVRYTGDAEISGVPGTAAPVVIEFPPGAGELLLTGKAVDVIDGVEVTCVNNGMPTVLIAAASSRSPATSGPGTWRRISPSPTGCTPYGWRRAV